MKWLFKWLLRLVLLAVVLVVLLFLFKDPIVRTVAEHRMRSRTGLDVRIGRVSSGLFSPAVTIENLKIYNTAEFGGTPFLDIPELHVEIDPLPLARGELHIALVRFNLAEIDVVRNELGQTNTVTLLNKVRSSAPKKDRVQKWLENLEFTGIDVLNLSFGKTKYIDLGNPANNHEEVLNLQNQVFKNVKSEADAYGILFMVWLRSGGKFSLSPADLTKDFVRRKAADAEKELQQALEKVGVKTPKP